MATFQPLPHSTDDTTPHCLCDPAFLSAQFSKQGRRILPEKRPGDIYGTREPFLTALKPYVREQVFQRAVLTRGVKDFESRHNAQMQVCLMGSFERSWKLPPIFNEALGSVMLPVSTPSQNFVSGAATEKRHLHTIPAWEREPQWLIALGVNVSVADLWPFRNHKLDIPPDNCPFVDSEAVSDLITLCNDNSYMLGERLLDRVARIELADDLLSQTKIANLFKEELRAEGLVYPQRASAANASVRASRKSRHSRRSRLSHTASAPMPFYLPSASIASGRGAPRLTPGNVHTTAADVSKNWCSSSLEK
ncbi:hypothetical protein GGF50DRAFT_115372 [Schizophyllum commune]